VTTSPFPAVATQRDDDAHETADGVFAPAVGYPTVAEGKARLRAMVSATHKRDQLLRAADILAEVAKPLGIVS